MGRVRTKDEARQRVSVTHQARTSSTATGRPEDTLAASDRALAGARPEVFNPKLADAVNNLWRRALAAAR